MILIYCSTRSRRTFCLRKTQRRQAEQTKQKFKNTFFYIYRAPEGEIDLNLNKLKGQRTRQQSAVFLAICFEANTKQFRAAQRSNEIIILFKIKLASKCNNSQ